MNSEKVKEIKKALECCSISCTDCPYDKGETTNPICINNLAKNALTLINELESENETIRLNMQETEKASFNINQMNGNLVLENQQLKDRIAELEKGNARLNKLFTYDKSVRDRCFEFIKDIKEEALKQFAERLKDGLEEYRLENEYFIKDEPNGNLWQMNASVFCIEVIQDGGLVDETLKEFIEK